MWPAGIRPRGEVARQSLSVHQHHPARVEVRARLPQRPDEPLPPGRDALASRPDDAAQRKQEETGGGAQRGQHHRKGDDERNAGRASRDDRADQQREQARRAEQAEARLQRLGEEQPEARPDQDHAEEVDAKGE